MPDEFKQLSRALKKITENEVLASYTTFNIGGPARYFYIASSNDEIINAIKTARRLNIDFFILGSGSNILIADRGFDGLVIKMENNRIEIKGELVWAESGVKLQKLIRETIAQNLSGFENLMGIPGTLGGGVAGNVGTPTEWIDQHLIRVRIINANNDVISVTKSSCDFSYRFSRFKNNNAEIILGAEFKLKKASQNTIQEKVKKFLDSRSVQPTQDKCAGSVFKNPKGYKAWQLIDKIGFRGKKIGGAKVSDRHSNFIVNTGKATAEDVVVLISLIKQQVRDKLGVQLQEEIKYIGFE